MNAVLSVKDKLLRGVSFETSPYQTIVDQATSEFMLVPDWDKNLQITEQINKTPGESGRWLIALRKRIEHSNTRVQFLALTLLETCVRQCGRPFRAALDLYNPIIQEVIKLASRNTKKSSEAETSEKALVLLETWSANFPRAYSNLSAARSAAIAKGAVFSGVVPSDVGLLKDEAVRPKRDSNSSVPARAQPLQQHSQQHPEPQEHRDIGEFERLRTQMREATANEILRLIEEAQSNVGLLEELIAAESANPAKLKQDDLCQQVVASTRSVQGQILDVIESGVGAQSEGTFELLLQSNDSLLKVITKYEECVTRVGDTRNTYTNPLPVAAPATSTAQPQLPVATGKAPLTKKDADIDFDEFLGMRDDISFGSNTAPAVSAPLPAAPAKAVTQAPVAPPTKAATIFEDNEFDEFLHSRASLPASKAPEAKPAKSTIDVDDEFDVFFKSR